ncbi:MAG: LLM class flavin-dependent oxidoreductase [Bacteroidia bacterium]
MLKSDVEIFTQPVQWLDYDRYQVDLELNHKMNAAHGFTGSLCYLNHNDFFDPWLLASQLVCKTGLKPLVAVNPAYHHPYIIARSVFTLSQMRNGPISLNFIAGTATTDLQQIGEMYDKKRRYERLGEMMQIVHNYLFKKEPWSFEGSYYNIECSSFLGDLASKPDFFVAGHSNDAIQLSNKFDGVWARSLLADDLIKSEKENNVALGFGLFVGENAEQAKQALSKKLGLNKSSDVLFRLKMANTDAQWKKEQSKTLDSADLPVNYFAQTIKSQVNVPFLVGTENELSSLVRKQILDRGIKKFILPVIDEIGYEMIKNVFAKI